MKYMKNILLILSYTFFFLQSTIQADPVYLDVPAIIEGKVIQNQYYYGPVKLASLYDDQEVFRDIDKRAYYSIDEGLTWQDAIISEKSIQHSIPVENEYVNEMKSGIRKNQGYVVCWVDEKNEDQKSAFYYVYCRVFDDDGNPLGDAVQVNVKPQTGPIIPDLAVLDNGEFIVIWNEKSASSHELYGRRFTGSGEKYEDPFLIHSYEIDEGYIFVSYKLKSIPGKGFVVVWCKGHHDNSQWGLYSKLFDMEAIPLGAEVQITNSQHIYFETLGLDDGGFLVAWPVRETDAGGDYIQVYGSRINSYGLVAEACFPVMRTGNMNAEHHYVCFPDCYRYVRTPSFTLLPAGDDHLWLSWLEYDDSSGEYRYYIQNYTVSSKIAGTKNPVYSAVDVKNTGFITVEEGGFILLVNNPVAKTILLNRYDANLAPVFSEKILNYNDPQEDIFIRSLNLGAVSSNKFIFGFLSYTNNGYFHNICNYTGRKIISSGQITPNKDISVLFKLVDTETGEESLSPVRYYRHADQNDGKGGSISYLGGYTNKSTAMVSIILPDGVYRGIQLYYAQAPAGGSSCEFGNWKAYGNQNTFDTRVNVIINDGYAYKFKWIVSNMAGFDFEYRSGNILVCDQTAPIIGVIDLVPGEDILNIGVSMIDQTSGIALSSYILNDGEPLEFTGNNCRVSLASGMNHIILEAWDKARNKNEEHIFYACEEESPEIYITGIMETGVYNEALGFSYYTTRALHDIILYADNKPVRDLLITADNQPVNGLEEITAGIHDIEIRGIDISGRDTLARLHYVDGDFTLDLRDMDGGIHFLTIEGKDGSGMTVSESSQFTIDRSGFSFILLSPQSRLYEIPGITIEYKSSEPISSLSWNLDGGPARDDLYLENLPDGDHSLVVTAVSSEGSVIETTVNFTVKEVFPTLTVIQPEPGKLYTQNPLGIIFKSNSPVEYAIADKEGQLESGDMITLPEDNEYVLILTATHPVSGNTLIKNITFRIDTLTPKVRIISPEPVLYAHDEIPVDYRANKALRSVTCFINDKEIQTLHELIPGDYLFHLNAEDFAGRVVDEFVQFKVTELSIISPKDGERIITDAVYPVFNLQYEAEGPFQSITHQVDKQEEELVNDPPGAVIPIRTNPGTHELVLRGYVNEFKVATTSDFQIGRKNIHLGKGCMNYTYAETGIDGLYTVELSVRLFNSGEIDIMEPVPLRFDHITQSGDVTTQWSSLTGLESRNVGDIILTPVQAAFGDLFLITVDPESTLTGEWPDDNFQELVFQTGQILQAADSLADDNVYLQNVSVFNYMGVAAAGPIASVEFRTRSKIFVDNTPESGFTSIVDMGLLTQEQNYVSILAYGENGIVLDSMKYYFNIKRLNDSNLDYVFPWAHFAGSGSGDPEDKQKIYMSDIDLVEFAAVQTNTLRYSMINLPAVVPEVDEDMHVTYTITNVVSTLEETTYTVDMSMIPMVGQKYELPNGLGYIVFTKLDLTGENCINIGAVAVFDGGNEYIGMINRLWQETIENLEAIDDINEILGEFGGAGNLEELLDLVWDLIIRYSSEGLQEWINGAMKDNPPQVSDMDSIQDFLNSGDIALEYFGDYFYIGTNKHCPAGGLFFQGVLDFSIKDSIEIHAEDLNFEFLFDGKACFICDAEQNLLDIEGEAELELDIDTAIYGSTPGAYASVNGILGTRAMFMHFPILQVGGFIEIDPVNFYIPLHAPITTHFVYQNSRLFIAPAHLHLDKSLDINTTIAKGEVMANLLWFPFGFGMDVKVILDIDANVDVDIIAGIKDEVLESGIPDIGNISFDSFNIHPLYYGKFDLAVDVKFRPKDCFYLPFPPFRVCRPGLWDQWIPKIEETYKVGVKYDQKAVDDLIEEETIEVVLPIPLPENEIDE